MTPRQLADFIVAEIAAQGIAVDPEGNNSHVLVEMAPTVNFVLIAEHILAKLRHEQT